MAEGDEPKKIEAFIKKEEDRLEKEIHQEEKAIKTEENALNKDIEELSRLKKEEKSIDTAKKKVTEVEVELNFDSIKKNAKKAGNVAYNIFLKKRVLFYVILLFAVMAGWYIHTASIPALLNPLQSNSSVIGNNYLNMGGSLTGLDPYIFYIHMNEILQTGNVPAIEPLQYYPIGFQNRAGELLISFFGAYAARIVDPIVHGAVPMTSFMYLPAFFTIFPALVLFFLCLALFGDYWIASISAFILPAFLTFLSRSNAGFSQKTSMVLMFILLAIYFVAKSVKSNRTKSKVVYGFAFSIVTGMAMTASGYSEYLLILIPVFYILLAMLDFAKKGDLYAYIPFGLIIPMKMSMMLLPAGTVIHSVVYYPMLFAYLIVIFRLVVYDRYRHKLKLPFISNGVSVILYSAGISILLLLAAGASTFHHFLNDIYSEILYPLGVGVVNPVSQTIAEYQPLNLLQRAADYNFILGGSGSYNAIPVNFLLFSIGGIFLFYIFLKRFKHWYIPFLLGTPFMILLNSGNFNFGLLSYSFLGAFMAGELIPVIYVLFKRDPQLKRYISAIVFLTAVSFILSIIFLNLNAVGAAHYYKYGALALVAILVLTFAFDKQEEDRNKTSIIALLLFTFMLFTVTFSNIESRFLEPTEFIAAVVIPFAFVMLFRYLIRFSDAFTKHNKNLRFMVTAIIIIAAVIIIAVDLNNSLTTSYQVSQQSGSGLLLWGPTMQWIGQNTPTNSAVLAWWDYGYWIEAIANRTSVADGSNAYGYQTMIAKYFFEATSPYTYSTYLNFIHQPKYAVISGSEVLKFSAISTIALKPTSFSPISLVGENYNKQNIGNASYKYVATFSSLPNLVPLYFNGTIPGEAGSGSNYFLVNVTVPFNATNSSVKFGNPYVILYNNLLQQLTKPIPMDYNCVYGQGCTKVTDKGVPGGIMLLNPSNNVNLHIGGFGNITGGYVTLPVNLTSLGNSVGALFMPNETLNTLFTKLYLLNETVPGFKLVFTDNLPVNSLVSIENQVLTNVNVYEINYSQISKYNLLSEQCSISPSNANYCANLSYLPPVFKNNTNLINTTPIN